MQKKYFYVYCMLIFFSLITFLPVNAQINNTQANNQELVLKRIHAFIDTAMKGWNIPGLAIGIVKNGKIIYAEGFGIRSIKDKTPVTTNTLFGIASCSKAFTTMGLGILADSGKIEWDKPVRNYYPAFKLKDDFASERMTLCDMVTHKSGMPRHDMLWYGTIMSRKELIERLQYLEPSKDFRSEYQYNNNMFMTAGYVAGLVNGTTWEEFTKEKILKPLKMNSTNFSVNDSKKSNDYAMPHQIGGDEKLRQIELFNVDELGPAGSINSTVNDMLNWIQLHLNKGVFEGKRIISEKQITKMHTPHMFIKSLPTYPKDVSQESYGLGWSISFYRGHYRVDHGGLIDGFASKVMLFPVDSIGIVVLTNLGGNSLPGIACQYAFDLLMNLEPIDWLGRTKARIEENKKKEKDKKPEEWVKNTKPSHKLSDYCGEYENPAYGKVYITGDDKTLKAKYNIFNFTMEHRHYDVFKAKPIEVEDEDMNYPFSFYSNPKGEIDRLTLPLEPAVKDIVFMKKQVEEKSRKK
jgi:CubicO group peptidase (beta-lactamase class C family)